MQLDEPGYAGFTELFGIKIFTAIFLHQNGDCSSHYKGVILLSFFFQNMLAMVPSIASPSM